ncbi:amidohydrolase [Virgibacillus sp. C22-A2]|uniref:Amidohydrolase n=1 Tax=Virgibacillus tibetensis TaxID=3042313 RepID=A0ABU6KDF1_9BACI|nr:amidohydrolase [Virgibacillus sp. C22-A2]
MNIAEILFKNANILTLDNENTKAGSIAVSEGRITGIWKTPEPPEGAVRITEDTTIADLKGQTLIPGFIDTHNHILMYGLLSKQVNCSTPLNKTIVDIAHAIEQKVKDSEAGEWIQGYGYDDTLLDEKRHPTRHDLDHVAPDHPVIISHISGHLAVANSIALELAGLTNETTDPSGGYYGRDEDGNLNGVLYEATAMEPTHNLLPKRAKEEMIEVLGEAAKTYMAQGITTNTDAAVFQLEDLEVHLQAAKQGVNPMRTQLMIMHFLLREGGPFEGYSPSQLDERLQQHSNGLARLDSAKMFQDGSIQGLTGALREPYHQNPDTYGSLIHDQDDFNEEVLDLHHRGFRITTHGNGDRAIGSILDAYELALQKYPRDQHKHRIEHVQSATPQDIEKMAKLDVAGSFFINHVYYWGDRHEQIFLGPKRARRISPLADAVKHNLLFTLHSDCPVTPISPLFSIWAAVNRKTSSGKILGAEQRIDVITALKSMTSYAAELISDEDNIGSLEVGKLADFAVLDRDPTEIDSEEIKDIAVTATYIGGRLVYSTGEVVIS